MTIQYLHVIHSIDPRGGGPAEGVKQLTRVATRLKHRVEIAVLERPEQAWVREYDCPIHEVGPSYFRYGYAPKLAGWLQKNFSRFSAVVVNGLWQYQSFCTWRVLRGTSLPYFVFTHGMLDPWFRHRYPLKHLKKMAYWPWAEYRVLRDAAAVLFTSEEERLLARQSFSRYEANEVVVNYGVPQPAGDPQGQRDTFLKQFPQLRGQRFLLFLSRIHPKKGCDLLIEAFATLSHLDPALQLVIAGPDEVGLRRPLTELARRLGVERSITWTGMIRDDVKLGAFRAADAFILPSHQENFGIAVAEALACATPVLISNKVNIWREVVADGAGFADEDSLAGTLALLQRWHALSAHDRHAMALNAYACFWKRFQVETAANSILDIIARSGMSEQQSVA
jgi:glycosyltransferase involved in cell wall biosynthesis